MRVLNVSILRGTTAVSASQGSLEMDTVAQVSLVYAQVENTHAI